MRNIDVDLLMLQVKFFGSVLSPVSTVAINAARTMSLLPSRGMTEGKDLLKARLIT
jgi:hypothetical protein